LSILLLTVVAVLIGIAIAVQVYYVVGMRKAGVEVNTATKVVVGINVALLSLIGLGLLAFLLFNESASGM